MSATCRVCEGAVSEFLSLGALPLANAFVPPSAAAAPEPRFPLALQFCPSCSLVQLTETVSAERMFSQYLYVPGVSSSWREHCTDLAAYIRSIAPSNPFVLEVGSNDGTLLRAIESHAGRILGVDPAANVAAAARANGIPTETMFFGAGAAEELAQRFPPPDVIVATNVLGHATDVLDFVQGVARVLRPTGRFVVEVPYLREMLDGVAFDQIYHEHVSYFSVAALQSVLDRCGLELVDISLTPTHGGSLRATAAHSGRARPAPAIGAIREQEDGAGVNDVQRLERFARAVEKRRDHLLGLFQEFRASGLTVDGYGATAKGNVLLNYLGLGPTDIRRIGDRNLLKQGTLAPGTRIPVVSAEAIESDPPAILFVLAWNLAEEIATQFEAYRAQGGRLLVAFPEVRLERAAS